MTSVGAVKVGRRNATLSARLWAARVRLHAGQTLAGKDLSLAAAAITFYAAIAVVPVLLLAIRAVAALTSPGWVSARAQDVALLLPDALGARSVVLALADAGTTLSLLGIVVAIFPATFYGEGVRRALLLYRPRDDNWTGWRGRIATVPFVLCAPLLLIALLVVGQWLTDVTVAGGVWLLVLRIWIGFVTTWLVLAVGVGWAFAVIGPGHLGWRAVTLGALTTASFLAGFVQGFVLFLAIPVDLGAPFGGFTVIGAVIAAGLWMFLLHVILLLGWILTLALDRQRGRLHRAPLQRSAQNGEELQRPGNTQDGADDRTEQ